MRYKCLVLDHDETVVQTEKTLGYPFFCQILQQFRPGLSISLADYVQDCNIIGFTEMCKKRFHFTDAELKQEHDAWSAYIRQKIPETFPGIEKIIRRQKSAGGLLCVVSHSNNENILRDYTVHFGIQPDAIYGWDLPPHQRKPNPYPLTQIMKQYRLEPKDILVVDDAKLACQMAQPLGIDVAFAAWSKSEFPTLLKEMENLCKYTFYSTNELENFLFY